MYRTILFDLDGTLTDSKEGILNCLRYAFGRMGHPIPSEPDLLKFIGPPFQESLRDYCGFSPEEIRRATAYFRERYAVDGKFENAAAPGMVDLCRRLRDHGRVLAVASSKPENMCVPICEKYGFAPYMRVITGSGPSDDWVKADVIRETLRRLGGPDVREVLMVGDRRYDVEGAAECGIDCAGVEFFGYAEPGELAAAGAVGVFSSAGELGEFILNKE